LAKRGCARRGEGGEDDHHRGPEMRRGRKLSGSGERGFNGSNSPPLVDHMKYRWK